MLFPILCDWSLCFAPLNGRGIVFFNIGNIRETINERRSLVFSAKERSQKMKENINAKLAELRAEVDYVDMMSYVGKEETA